MINYHALTNKIFIYSNYSFALTKRGIKIFEKSFKYLLKIQNINAKLTTTLYNLVRRYGKRVEKTFSRLI